MTVKKNRTAIRLVIWAGLLALSLQVPANATSAEDSGYVVERDGRALRVEPMRCSAMPVNIRWPGHQRDLDQTEICGFVRFDFAGATELCVRPGRPFEEAVVRPVSKQVTALRDGDAVRFTLTKPGAYSVEFDGRHRNLMVFADPPREYSEIDRTAPNVRYFGPGEHEAGLITLKAGETLFLDEGAVVYGRVYAKDAPGIRICGRGILDASKVTEVPIAIDPKLAEEQRRKGWEITNVERFNTVDLHFCDGARLDGFTIRDSQIYAVRPVCCDDFTVDNVKVLGSWRYNSDGIDMHNCRKVRIRDCFVRTYDDSICVKGFDNCLPESEMLHGGVLHDFFEDVLVEGCTIWNDWGHALEIGAETRAREIRGITFRDCDILQYHNAPMDVKNCDQAHVHDIVWEKIRVEVDPLAPATVFSECAREFDPKKLRGPGTLASAAIFHAPEYSKAGAENRGRIYDVVFREIDVTGPALPGVSLRGFDEEHRVERVAFHGIRFNGEDVTDRILSDAAMRGFASVFRAGISLAEATERAKGRAAEKNPADILVGLPDYIAFVPRMRRGGCGAHPSPADAARLGDSYNDHFHVMPDERRGLLYAFWTQGSVESSDIDHHLVFSKSSDKGRTWSEPVVLAGSECRAFPKLSANWQQPMLSRSGRLYCIWNQQTTSRPTHCGAMFGIYSDNAGETWSMPKEVPFGERMDMDPEDIRIPPSWVCWQRPLRLGADGRYLVGCSRHGKAPYDTKDNCKVEFFQYDNIDDEPEVQAIRLLQFATNRDMISADRIEPIPGVKYFKPTIDPFGNAEDDAVEEAAIVKLPDGRLFALMRSSVGCPVWSQSRDAGRTWSRAKALLGPDGSPYPHPRSPCPIYDWMGPEAGSGMYFALIHNRFDPTATTAYQFRGMYYLIAGRFDPLAKDGEQPIRFGTPKLFLPRRGGNACYSSYTVLNGEGVLWFNDLKYYLIGRKVGKEWFE